MPSMKSVRLVAVLLILFAAPVLFACEDCYLRGMRTPAGTRPERAICWSSPEGTSEGCLPNQDGTNCQLWSYGTSCPESDEGGSGGAGEGGGTGSGGSCSTTAAGACPPECISCGGGGGGFLF